MEGATILDFGIARSAGSARAGGPTLTGTLIGTPGYMAPEQVRGRGLLSPSVDVFALGCVLFECLTGRPPFRGDYLETVLVRILFEAPPSLRSLRPELPAALESLLERMLCKEPAQRIADAGALLHALHRLAEQLAADPSTPGELAESRPVPHLGAKEQQLVSVLVGHLESGFSLGETLALSEPQPQPQAVGELDSLRRGLAELGVRSELLVDGTFVATITAQEAAAATDQANRAARCALLLRAHFPTAAVALATGRAVLDGPLPLGEATSRAVQLSHRHALPTVPGAPPPILMDPVTAGLLDSRFATLAVDADAVMLLGEPGSNESRRLLGKLTACVGRDRELELLDATLDACINESTPSALIILAPAGLGKSRLRLEFERRLSRHRSEVLLLLGRGELMGASAPFSLLRQALLTLCAIQAGDTPESRRAKLRQRIRAVVPAASSERTVLFLGELCGVPFADAPSGLLWEARQQPQVMQEAIRQAFLTFLRAQCAAQPVVLVLEDLQWADVATVQLLDAALRELDGTPLFLLGLSRPEGPAQFPKLWPETAAALQLRPLNRRAREQLIRQVLDHASAEVVARLAAQCEGNALYLEELIRAEVEGKAEAPPTVLAMLQARIGRLEAAARRVLRAASVFGESCWSGGISALLGVDESEALRWLHYLTRQEVLEQKGESRFLNQTEFFFRHALMRDAAYDLLPPEDRVLAHALAGRFLEQAGESAAVLAHHFQHGKTQLAAAHYYERAGDEAAAMSVRDQAHRYYAAALASAQAATPGPQSQRLQADLLVKQVTVGLMLEPAAAQLQRLAAAQERLDWLAAQGGEGAADEDLLRRARLDYLHGRVLYYDNQPIAALRYHQRVLPIVARLCEPNLRVLNKFAIGRAYVLTGQFGRARQLLSEAIEPMAELGDRSEWSRCFSFYAMALAATGRYAEALQQLERGLEVARTSEQKPVLALFQLTRSGAHLQAADWPRAVEAAQAALSLNEHAQDKTVTYMALDTLAWAESQLGRAAQALTHRAAARALRQSVGGGICRDWYEAADAELLLQAGQPEAALQQAQTVLAALAREEFPFSYAIAERAVAGALARLHRDPAEVRAHFQTALAICRAHEQVVNEALTEVFWGRILSEADADDPEAARHFQLGITLLARSGCAHAAAAAQQHAVGGPKTARQGA